MRLNGPSLTDSKFLRISNLTHRTKFEPHRECRSLLTHASRIAIALTHDTDQLQSRPITMSCTRIAFAFDLSHASTSLIVAIQHMHEIN
jgi:phosphopantetheinyl transferase